MARKVFAFALILLLAGSMAAFAQAAAKYVPASKVTLTFWHSYTGSRLKLFDRLVKEFMQENPKIEIKLSYGGDLRLMRDKMMTAIGGGAGPDIAEIDAYWTPIFADTGALFDLAPYMAATKYDQSDLMEACLQSTQFKGENLVHPLQSQQHRPLLQQEAVQGSRAQSRSSAGHLGSGHRVREEADQGQEQRRRDRSVGITMPLKANFGAVWYWLAFFWQQGGVLFNAQHNAATFNSDAGVPRQNSGETWSGNTRSSPSPPASTISRSATRPWN